MLVELLTRKKPCLYLSGGNDGVGLVSHFVSLLAEGNLDEIIDPQLIEEENGEVQEAATLAAMCIKLKGRAAYNEGGGESQLQETTTFVARFAGNYQVVNLLQKTP